MWAMLPFFTARNLGTFEISLAELFSTETRFSGVGIC